VDAPIDDPTLGARQASVTLIDGEARLRDLGCASGTSIDGVRISEATLQNGARFWLGQHTALKYLSASDADARYQRMLAESARHEPLTGVHNRRHFRECLGAEVAAAQRHGRPLSLLAVDMDSLGRVNEEHGVFAGDEAIKLVAYVLQGAIRKEDTLARVGGGRFHVLARETGVTGARALAERIRRAVERSRSSFGGSAERNASISVTVSIGVAHFEHGGADHVLLDAAGHALARAKASGRNAVVVGGAADALSDARR
jgi:diguanylate cyclase (GGDEF)-like protein